ncbi:hypothetical protein FRC10_002561 [Ceratobasidium sp. 414]|nr:hypothetical protein FRC10_002561 [Ceratobasidium sp. 414]
MAVDKDTQGELEHNLEQEQQERLVSAAKHRLDKYEAEIDAQTQKRPIRRVKRYSVGVNNKAGDAIADTVNSFFGITEDGEHDSKRTLAGFKREIETGLYAILGTNQLGEHEEQRSVEFVHHHALMCVDVRPSTIPLLQPLTLPPDVFCKSVLDRKSLTPTQLAYLLSEHSGDKNIEAYIDKLVEVWSKMDGMPEGVMSPTEAQITVLKAAEVGLAED